ncbi:MAG: periplasmic heavy metal sensor [Bacteroidota bacterium]|nr:periplasmic heavy metal sensor [Rhodothermia bacterium]MCS7154515.1 periplasmic heavy metal sensor [Bacteroidota bacterium]MDW8136833.1 periplasmic heavy metal sensor [Bacteroidota bacterium]MDW8285297.1 periplasmic heavy metal sensor [Bacteroidota bacterium]
MSIVLIVASALVLAMHEPTWAQGTGQTPPLLTAEQRQRVQEARDRFRREAIDLHAALQRERLELERLLRAENPDMARVEAQLRRISEAETRLRMARIRFGQELRQIVGPEQYQRLRQALGRRAWERWPALRFRFRPGPLREGGPRLRRGWWDL